MKRSKSGVRNMVLMCMFAVSTFALCADSVKKQKVTQGQRDELRNLILSAKTPAEKREVMMAFKQLQNASNDEEKSAARAKLDKYAGKAKSDTSTLIDKFTKNPVFEDEKVAAEIKYATVAEYLLEHGDFSGLKSRTEYIGGRGIEYSDSYQAAVIIKAIVQRLGDAKLNELAAEAKKRAEEKRSSTMVFGDFYLDMPTLDFFVLARVMRINPDWDYKTMTAEQDWKKRFVVSSFEFKAKDRASILDCEDSLVLQQVIHQCVKHKDGKATILDYVGEIDTDAKVEKSWDGRSLEVGVWTEYVNTKLDVKIRYNKKEGTLDFSHR